MAPGKTIYLVLGYAGTQLTYSSTCATSVVALKIQAAQTTAPSITLSSPGQGALISGGQPVFSGSAANGFGDAGRVSSTELVFSGRAGDALGDSTRVTVLVYRGGTASGKPVGTLNATRSGTAWTGRLARRLKPGRYTARATQTDDAGHIGRSAVHRFRVIERPNPIGPRVELSRRGRATAAISCLAPASRTCRGSVLIFTVHHYRTSPGGPSRRLRVMFAYVTIRGGRTVAVTRKVEPDVAQVLRRAAPRRSRSRPP